MSNLTTIQHKENSLAVAQMTLFIDATQVASAKETSKDLLAEIADTLRRIKRIGARNGDINICKWFEDIPLGTFKFLCNQYKVKYEFEHGAFQARLYIEGSFYNHSIVFRSEKQQITLQEIETINQ